MTTVVLRVNCSDVSSLYYNIIATVYAVTNFTSPSSNKLYTQRKKHKTKTNHQQQPPLNTCYSQTKDNLSWSVWPNLPKTNKHWNSAALVWVWLTCIVLISDHSSVPIIPQYVICAKAVIHLGYLQNFA